MKTVIPLLTKWEIMDSDFQYIKNALDYEFTPKSRIIQAFTTKSYAKESA